MDRQTQAALKVLASFVIVIGILVFMWWWPRATREIGVQQFGFADKAFWAGTVTAKDGYLVTERLIPIRAIARRPNVPMFSDAAAGARESFQQVMQPWKPYYVYEYNAARKALRIGDTARPQKGAGALWVLEGDVYCWTTREVLNIERGTPIYASLDDARQGQNRIKEQYTFAFADHAVEARSPRSGHRLPIMAALPVLRKEEGKYVSFIRPDPEPQADLDRAYQVGWIRWEGNDDTAAVRIRITRTEFEEYTGGLQKLLFDYRYGSPDEKTSARTAITAGAQGARTGEEKAEVGRFSATDLDQRSKGIPHPSGILLVPIQSELQASNIENRLLECLKIANDRSMWDRSEIAYIEISRMP